MRLRALAITAAMAAALAPLGSSPAHADRCQPEELVLGPASSPMDERDSAVCYALLYFVYPFICTNSTTLITCAQSTALNPGYRPSPPPFQPNVNRTVCNAYLFANSSGSCTYTTSEAGK